MPPPDGLGVGAESPGYLGPRQARLLLETLQALREVGEPRRETVVGEDGLKRGCRGGFRRLCARRLQFRY